MKMNSPLLRAVLLAGCLVAISGCAAGSIGIDVQTVERYPDSTMLVEVTTNYSGDTLNFGTARIREWNLRYVASNGDSLELRIWYPGGVPVDTSQIVLLIHGNSGSTFEMYPLAVETTRCGLVTGMVSLRGFGLNRKVPASYGLDESNDASEAISEYMKRHRLTHVSVGVFGVSLGGMVAVNLAADDRRVRGLALEGLILDLETSAKKLLPSEQFSELKRKFAGREDQFREKSPDVALDRLPAMPVFARWGSEDKLVSAEERERLKELISTRSSGGMSVDVQGGGHTMRAGFPLSQQKAREGNEEIALFLQRTLRR